MDRVEIIFLVILYIIVLPAMARVYAETIAPFIRRRVPDFSCEREVFLLWGLLLVAAFAFQLAMIYLLLKE
jgi:hypothetical protein